jgi:DNA-binding transcriptional ArsR family regulator
MQTHTLEVSPVRPPALGKSPEGRRISFEEIVRSAGMRNVVTLSRPLDIRLHGGPLDFKVPTPGGAIYCLAGTTLPAEREARARELLRRLAYGFNDYAAREVVARYHRDRKREVFRSESDEQVEKAKRALTKSSLRITRVLRERPACTIGELSELTGMAQPNVSRAISDLIKAGVVSKTRESKHVICRLRTTVRAATAAEASGPIGLQTHT